MVRRYVLATVSVGLVLASAFAAAPTKPKIDAPAQPKVAPSRVISVTERASYIARVRVLAKACCEAWLASPQGAYPPPQAAHA